MMIKSKYILCLIFILCIPFNRCNIDRNKGINAQDLLRKEDGLLYYQNEDKPFSGKFYGNDKNLYCEGFIKDGLQDGKFTIWFENGKKYYESNYKFGKLNGKCIEWYSSGQLKSIKNYDNGNLINSK